jgi:hypothetical protein
MKSQTQNTEMHITQKPQLCGEAYSVLPLFNSALRRWYAG